MARAQRTRDGGRGCTLMDNSIRFYKSPAGVPPSVTDDGGATARSAGSGRLLSAPSEPQSLLSPRPLSQRVPHPIPRAFPAAGACGIAPSVACGSLLLAAAVGAAAQGVAASDAPPPDAASLRLSRSLKPLPRGNAARTLPVQISARELRGRPDLDADAVGEVDFRRGGVHIEADRLHYDVEQDRARATGNVRIASEGNVYSGPEVELQVQRFEGYFLEPTYYLGRIGAGGSAARVDFIDADRAVATAATYSSCTPDGGGAPAWLLQADKVSLDLERNEGVAEGARLRFLGATILAAPRLSFPLTDARKSGWLPPTINLDNRSGLQVAVPYYWNIAPNRDATFTPQLMTRRGLGVDAEYRYLEPSFRGVLHANLLPHDLVAGRSRYALDLVHDGRTEAGWDLRLRSLRVSDNDYWKDFPRVLRLISPRLLPTDLQASRTRDWSLLPGARGDWTAYARVQRWQPIQDADPANAIVAPYERLPQVGARTRQQLAGGVEAALETELNHFVPPSGFDDPTRFRGVRAHAVGSLARPYGTAGWTLTPRLAFNAAWYDFDRIDVDRRHAVRLIPTASLDSAWFFERDTRLLGRDVRQTLEPRLRYVNTPFRDQGGLPNFDAATKDFNVDSIYTDNDFSGIDRVSDANRLTGGVTTRVIEPTSGAELVRLGVVQRYLFTDQRVTPEGMPFTAALLRPAGVRRDDAGAALDARRLAPVQPGDAHHRALDRPCALFARAVPHRQRHLPYHPRPERADGARLAVADRRTGAVRDGGAPPFRTGRRRVGRRLLQRQLVLGRAPQLQPEGQPPDRCHRRPRVRRRLLDRAHRRRAAVDRAQRGDERGCCSSSSWSACRGSARIRCRR